MKHKAWISAISSVLALAAAGAWAQDDVIDQAVEACEEELSRYCSQVTPGDGRLLACFYAHGDKISGRCEYGLYRAAVALDVFVTAIAHVAVACEQDLATHCAEVETGEGRVASCLLDRRDQLAAECRQAIDDIELEVVRE